MTLFYSAAAKGFFDDRLHTEVPTDAVEISTDRHAELLQSQSAGKIIVADEGGNPVAVEPRSLLSLNQLKDLRWQEVKQNRDWRIDGGCDVPGIGRFDTDTLSRSNINGAVTGAVMAKSADVAFAVQWKLADNSLAELDADQMFVVGQTVLAHVSTCHARSQALGLLIAAADTVADLEAIDIEEGWPA